jgi:hypothetical protein
VKFLLDILTAKFIFNFFDWVKKTFRLPSAFSWETLILLCLFSAYMSRLATDWVQDLLINLAWIFLILGVFWGTTSANQLRIGYKDPSSPGFPLSPWITGALVSLYIFGRHGEYSREALIYWPIISAIIAALPDFVGDGFRPKVPAPKKRQNLVILFGTQILLSCWFQFYFVVQEWLVQYPSMLVDDFQQSAFVMKRESAEPETPRGALILNTMEPKLAQMMNARPWSEIERSLLPANREKLIDSIENQAKRQIKAIEEDNLWQVVSRVSSRARASGYNLQLVALWRGPRAEPKNSKAYVVSKLCQVTPLYARTGPATKPINARPTAPTIPISRFQCNEVKGWGIDEQKDSNNGFIRL